MIHIAARQWFVLAVVACVGSSLVACASATVPTPTSTTTRPTSATSAPIENNPPGDIPDNQVYVPYRGTGFTVRVPEGWSRTGTGSSVRFTSAYTSITVDVTSGGAPPTVASVRSHDLPRIRSAAHRFTAGSISTVQRRAGQVVLCTYRALSPVSPVTGRVALLSVERYAFWRRGREVVLTLAGPVGADNVDPWRLVTNSLTWTTR